MSQERIEAFKAMVAQQPEQEMVWYGLANEYVKLERWDEAAEALARVLKLNADFTAAYQMLGTALMNSGQRAAGGGAWAEESKPPTARALESAAAHGRLAGEFGSGNDGRRGILRVK